MSTKNCVLLSALAILAPLLAHVRADEQSAADKPDEALQSEDARARSKFMMDALAEYQVEVDEAGAIRRPKLVPAPALRWTNTVSGTKDGVVGVWTSGGRPDVVVQFAGYGSLWIHHFALFAFVLATDPEALLMIEAYKTGEGAEWRYALVPMTVYGLIARLDGKEVWNHPENRIWKIDDSCCVGAH